MFPVYISKKMTAWLLIFMQLITPVAGMAPLVGHAAVPSGTQGTVQGLNALIMGEAGGEPSPTPSGPAGVNEPVATPYYTPPLSLPESSSKTGHGTSSILDATGLPDLSIPVDEKAGAGAKPHDAEPVRDNGVSGSLASGAMQAGGLLSSDNATDASINYAKGVGEGLINQQINDWLKQFGNAKVSLGSDKKVSGDMLIPLYDAERDLLFTQVGIRTGQERNTANLGLGYRQYLSDWMLGVNTFYDYDYTGQNKRLGVGAEAWRDYLKLAVNGYYRLTDWHQSVLSAMEDYDERPANGFDLRAEGYLPAWPNLGGTLKYEQYFGKGVSLSNSTSVDSLKDNPKALTAGVTYTPFPLMTLSAAHSVGDTNDTRVGLDLTYRLGVPWYRQVSPDSVDLMRSLAGSKYDFVDRNYEIVMQYRKQELLTISLPAATTAQAAETIPVVLTVSKAKYGLKSVSWNVDPLLTARGGRYQQVSPTELRVTLPAYIFGQKTNVAQNYKISVVATDNHDNLSNTAEMLIGVVPSENTVSSLTISPNDKVLPVDASKGYTITGVVTDGKGAPLANQSVTFSVDGLADAAGNSGATLSASDGKSTDSSKITVTTLADGKATVLLRSTVAGQATVTATMDNGNSSSGKVSFVADATTAAVTALVAEDDNATADGKAANSVAISVKDKFGNPVNGAEVYLTASNGAKIADKVSTNEQGSATVTLTNTKAGPSTVAASLNTSQKEVTVTFGVGKPALDASGIKTDKSDYTAGDDITVSAVLKDEQHNAITGRQALLTDSAVTVPNASAKSGSKWVEEAQTPGTYTRIYVAKTASENQTATLNLTGWSQASNAYSIIANMNKAAVMSIEAKDNNAVADGSAQNSVLVTVQDNYENRVSGAVVSLEASNGALIASSATTGQDGTVLATLTNTRAGVSKVTASLNSSSQSVNVGFGVGQPVRANSSIATDKTTYISGSDIQVEIALADQKQNAVAGLNSAKLNSMVTVPNAEAKSTTNWVESSTAGSYIGTYVAKVSGENLTSTLRISDGDTTSGAYAITAGDAVLVNSTITRDSDSYVSGTDIQVTVTLKDGNTAPNPVTGVSSDALAGMVTVANADAKSKANWVESSTKGTYVGTYVARAAGAGLKATLTIAGADKDSAAYAITAGDAVLANSTITRDSDSYVSGTDIQVTVTLKDGNATPNPVTGVSSDTLAGMVTVANADAKSKANWVESSTKGTYVGTYVARAAGAGLKATLTIAGADKDSAAYAITAGDAVLANSTITRDSDSYVSGTDIQVTVTLKDGNTAPNPVTGVSSDTLAGMVTVANADAKSKANWVESSTKGTYVGAYVARAAGAGLKATLTIAGADKDSAAYAITAGDAVLANSTITRDSDSYVSGTDIQVTVTLKDGNATPNPVTGVSSDTLAGMVTVANADAKSKANWVESSTKGTYVGTYVARAAGAGLKATLTIAGADKDSAAYAITAGDAVLANSTITRDSDSYVSGTDIQVTVTLKDGNATPNPVTGVSSDTLAGMVTVANADAKSKANWVESSTKGTYVGTYVARAAGAGLKATLTIAGADKDSAAYAITAGDAVLANSTITRDSDSYVSGTDIQVTVTLKDGNATPNPVTGVSSDTLAGMVTVANADAKSKANWVESSTKGTYVGAYVARAAGAGLKATLTIGSASSTTKTYSIVAGGSAIANSAITRDSDSYVSGTDIQVTVTLKDGNATPNPVTGVSSDTLAGMVTVANADAKSKANWVESSTKGTYVGTYVARAAGAGLKATLTIAGADKDSAAYAITAGDAVLVNSTITRDSDSYVSGTDIQVTVTLKDGNATPNPVTGVSSDTLAGMVTVANADAKSKANWVESSTKGTYVGTYVARAAGAGLKATLTIAGADKDSAAYAITAGDAVLANSTITRDSDSYVSGTDIQVTVTLKDGNATPNPVTGVSSDTLAGMVTVANADAKSKANWVESSTKGTYVGTYVARAAGAGLKATLTIAGADKDSAAYAITAGDAVLANSTITRDSDSYVSGTDIQVTVTLKDGNATPNPVTGVSSDTLAGMVTVANADAKSKANWVESSTKGTYVGAYVARAAGAGLKATLTIAGADKDSAAYAITAGDAVLANSTITRDSDSYVSGTDIQVTVTLKDGNATPNPVTGVSSDTLAGMVTVANADAKSKANWVESSTKGTYVGTYVARAAGANLKATLTTESWEKESATYSIVADVASAHVDTVTLSDDTTTKFANGSDFFTYNALVVDLNDNPVKDITVAWSQDKGEAVTLSDSTSITNVDGVAAITLKSSTTLVADVGVSAQYAKMAKKDANHKVTFTYGEAASVTVNTTDNATTAVVGTQPTLKIAVLDSSGHQLPNKTVTLAVGGNTNASVYPTSVSSNADGEISTQPLVADTTAQVVTITASLTGSDIKGTLDITFIPDVVSANTSTIIASPESIKADTVSTSQVTYVAKDRYGNIINSINDSSITSGIVGMSKNDVALSDWNRVGEGNSTKYTVTVTAGSTIGSLKVIPIINGEDGVSRTGNDILTLVPGDIDLSESSISATPKSIVADGKSTSSLLFIPRDKFKNIISTLDTATISQSITGEATDMTVSQWTWSPGSKWYTAILTAGVMPGVANIMPTVAGENAASQGINNTLTLNYSSSVKDIDTQSTGTAIADGSQTNQMTVTVYGENKALMSNIDVTITPSNDELLINGKNEAFIQKTNDKGQITVSMASTFIGSNDFTVESDQYSEVGNTSFGIYVSPTLSSVRFDKTDLYNNGTDKMTVTLNAVDAKGRGVSGLNVSFSSTDSNAGLISEGYKTIVTSTSSPSTYFMKANISNYTLWSPDSVEYNLIPTSGVLLGVLEVSPKLCGATSQSTAPVNFDACSGNSSSDGFYYSGLGFVVTLKSKSDLWDGKLTLKSSEITGEVNITPIDTSSKPFNCSLPVTSTDSWMNDFYSSNNYSVDISLNTLGESFDTYSSKGTGTGNGGAGICNVGWDKSAKKVTPLLSGSGSVLFDVTTKTPVGTAEFRIPLQGERIDQGVIRGVNINIYSK